MTFEEFFKKKKINLQSLEQVEPGLFSEFKIHFGQMGEKSFDHTKKYWFNKLRLRFPAPPEVKAGKVVFENPLAEQTIVETLTEDQPLAPAVGFKPRFKAGATKPADPATPEDVKEEPATDQPVPESTPAIGFKPRFKAGVTKPVTSEEEDKKEEPATDQPVPASTPSIGFKPRFKAGVTKPAEAVAEEDKKEEPATDEAAPAPTVGFKPRFKAGVTKPANQAPGEKMDGPEVNGE